MPRNVRNWWVELNVDGRGRVETGPASRDGVIDIRILARDRGTIVDSFHIDGWAADDGTLRLRVFGPDGEKVAEHITRR